MMHRTTEARRPRRGRRASRTPPAGTQHDQIGQVVNHLAQTGYGNIQTTLPDRIHPSLVQGMKQDHIPDVTADGVIVEVETSDTSDNEHTTSHWSLFLEHAANSGKTF